jgi:hypothetical protein
MDPTDDEKYKRMRVATVSGVLGLVLGVMLTLGCISFSIGVVIFTVCG